jgi:hypothetical protein
MSRVADHGLGGDEAEHAHSQQIREETRAAVDDFRRQHPPHPRSSASSDSTAASPEGPVDGHREKPSDGRFGKAGLIAAASGSGAAAKGHLGGSGMEGVDIPDKFGLFSPKLKNERKQVIKVSHYC